MPNLTDPASEFANLCSRLNSPAQDSGSAFLASKFEVEAWSFEFYQIIFCIIERAEQIKILVESIPQASHIAPDTIAHINDLLRGFQPSSMQRKWSEVGNGYVSSKNIQPIKILSAFLRMHVSYPSLSREEQEEVIVLVKKLTEWLISIQLSENDFIRQAIIDGLKQFSFRLERVDWLGWGYTVQSLKDVIGAYLALQGGIAPGDNPPQAEAILKRVGSAIKTIYEKVGVGKDVVERSDFLLKAYGAASMYVHSHHGIAGLLTFQ